MVLDYDDKVLRASAAARSFGLVDGDELVVGELVALARKVRRDGKVREGEIEISTSRSNGRTTSFAVRVAALGPEVGHGGLVLLLAEDQTESRRVEEVRRDFVATSATSSTPVGALALLAETVEDAVHDPEAVLRFAGRMRQEAPRLTHLVQDLIMLSRIQAAEPVPDPSPIEVDVVVAEALDRCREKANAHGIELAASGEHGLVIMGDEDLLVTALRNLLENAVAYSPEKTRVLVWTRRVGANTAEVRWPTRASASPSGTWSAFRALLPGRPGTVAGHGGTGLGLAIARHVARPTAAGSRCGAGRLRIYLYAAAAVRNSYSVWPGGRANHGSADQNNARPAGNGQVTRALISRTRNRSATRCPTCCARKGARPQSCPTGPDAIETFDGTGADLVLLDLMLPGLPGSKVCRSLWERSNVPIIMLTAKVAVDKVVGLEWAPNDYVTKAALLPRAGGQDRAGCAAAATPRSR